MGMCNGIRQLPQMHETRDRKKRLRLLLKGREETHWEDLELLDCLTEMLAPARAVQFWVKDIESGSFLCKRPEIEFCCQHQTTHFWSSTSWKCEWHQMRAFGCACKCWDCKISSALCMRIKSTKHSTNITMLMAIHNTEWGLRYFYSCHHTEAGIHWQVKYLNCSSMLLK